MGSPGTKSIYWFVRAVIRDSFSLSGANVSATQANRKGDDIAQLASDYSPAELAYFKVLVGPYHSPFSTSRLCLVAILGRNDRHGTKFILLSFVDGGSS